MAIRIFEMAEIIPNAAPVLRAPFKAEQSGTVSGSSAQSSAFNAFTKIVVIQTDEACHLAFGDNPTATTSGFKLAAGGGQEFAVAPGSKVAWIAGA